MGGIFSKLFGAVPKETLIALAVASVVAFVATLVTIPFILIRLPEDYFLVRHRNPWLKDSHPLLRFIAVLLKNLAGAIFLLAGIAMLVLPGQGLLTMLIGITLLDFPGKQRLEAKIIGQPAVMNVINSLREKFGKPPLRAPSAED